MSANVTSNDGQGNYGNQSVKTETPPQSNNHDNAGHTFDMNYLNGQTSAFSQQSSQSPQASMLTPMSDFSFRTSQTYPISRTPSLSISAPVFMRNAWLVSPPPELPSSNKKRIIYLNSHRVGMPVQAYQHNTNAHGSTNGDTNAAERISTGTPKGVEANRIQIPGNIKPPDWLHVNTSKQTVNAFKPQYPNSSPEEWPSKQELQQFKLSQQIKPRISGSDVGIPMSDAESDTIARRFYEAIIDFRYFYGSTSSPVSNLLEGKYSDMHIKKRCVQLAGAVITYHTTGIELPTFADPNRDWNGGQKKDSEQNDSFQLRVDNIEAALRFSKLVACDLLNEKLNLAFVLLLAPRKALKAKMVYAESNKNRALKNKRPAPDEGFSPEQN